MARSRNIKPGLFLDEELAELKVEARYLFAGLWCLADKEGRLEDRPKRIKAEIYPYDTYNVNKLLDELFQSGHIIRYEVDSRRYIQVVNFVKHQNPHKNERPSEIPACDTSREITGAIPIKSEPLMYETVRLGLIPDSLNLIPDSLNLIPEAKRKELLTVIIFDAWKRIRNKPRAALSKERKQKVEERIKEKRLFCDFLSALYGVGLSKYHMGQNEFKKVYDDLFTICRDAHCFEEHVTHWITHQEKQQRAVIPLEEAAADAVDRGVIGENKAKEILEFLHGAGKAPKGGEPE